MPEIVKIRSIVKVSAGPIELPMATLFVIDIFSLVLVPTGCPYPFSVPEPIFEMPLKDSPVLPPDILPESIGSAVHVMADIPIPIFEVLFSLAMLSTRFDLSFVSTGFILNDSRAFGLISPPTPQVGVGWRLPLPMPVLFAGDELSLIHFVLKRVIGALPLGFVVDVHPLVHSVGECLVPMPVLAVVLELPLIEPILAADHQPESMYSSIRNVPNQQRLIFHLQNALLLEYVPYLFVGPPGEQILPLPAISAQYLRYDAESLLESRPAEGTHGLLGVASYLDGALATRRLLFNTHLLLQLILMFHYTKRMIMMLLNVFQ